jgi:hypothetical protein
LMLAGEKVFNQTYRTRRDLVRKLVVDCKIIPPDKVCAELAQFLPKAEVPPMPGAARGEEPK